MNEDVSDYTSLVQSCRQSKITIKEFQEHFMRAYQSRPKQLAGWALNFFTPDQNQTNTCTDEEIFAWVRIWQAWANHGIGNFLKAETCAHEALERFISLGHEEGRVRALNALMIFHVTCGQLDKAVEYSIQGEQIAEELGNEILMRMILVNTANIHIKIGSWDDAWTLLTRAQLLPAGSDVSNILILLSQGLCLLNSKQLEEARAMLIAAENKASQYGYSTYRVNALIHLARIKFLSATDLETKNLAIVAIAKARRLARRIENRHIVCECMYHEAFMRLELKQNLKAIRYLRKTLFECEQMGEQLLAREVHCLLASCLEEHYPRQALQHYKSFHNLELSIFTQRSTKAIEQEKRNRARIEADSYRLLYSQVATISMIGQEITACLDFDSVVDVLKNEINSLIPSETLGIALYDEEKNELNYSFFIENGNRLPNIHVPLDTGKTLGAWCLRHKKMIFSPDITRDWPQFLDFEPTFPSDEKLKRSVIFLPLVFKGKPLGVLSVQSGAANVFTPYHLDALRALASFITIALENASLFSAVQYRATYDALTGILNRASIIEHGEQSFQRWLRYGGSLSVLMVDVDHFKNINDTYGHNAGDQVIRQVAETLRQHLRNTDYVGRYGGEEFLFVLPETDEQGALTMAERVRQAMESNLIPISNSKTVQCTLSIGVHELQTGDQSFEQSVMQADKVLYWCKEHGRNRVATSSGACLDSDSY